MDEFGSKQCLIEPRQEEKEQRDNVTVDFHDYHQIETQQQQQQPFDYQGSQGSLALFFIQAGTLLVMLSFVISLLFLAKHFLMKNGYFFDTTMSQVS